MFSRSLRRNTGKHVRAFLLLLYKTLKTFSLVRSYDVEDDIRCVICCEPLDAAEFQSSCNIVEMFENHNLQSVISTLEDVVGGKFNINMGSIGYP